MPRPPRSPAAALAALAALALVACSPDQVTAPGAAADPRPSAVVAVLTTGTLLYDQTQASGGPTDLSAVRAAALLAADFAVPDGAAWAVSQVLIGGDLDAPTLTFAIHADDGGHPGAVLHTFTLAPAQSAAQTGELAMTDYLFALPAPAVLEPGTYWLAVDMGGNAASSLNWQARGPVVGAAPHVRAVGDASWTSVVDLSPTFAELELAFALYAAAAPQAQTVAITSTPPSPAVVGGTYTVTAAATSELDVAIGAGPAVVCTASEGVVTFVGAGTCTVTADQAGDEAYLPAAQVAQSVTVGKGPQTISFTSAPPSPAAVGGTYEVSASGGASGNTVTFSSPTASVCTVAGSTVTFVAGGTCTVAADQVGDAMYDAAPQQTQTFAVAKAPQAIAVTSAAPAPAYLNGTYTVVAAGGASGNPVVVSASPAGVCTATGATVTFVGVGTCTVAADQAGSAAYLAAPRVTHTVEVDYRFDGFAAPVDNGGVLNAAKAGQAIPLKWRLTDASGAPVTTLASAPVTVAGLACDLGGDSDALEAYAPSGSGLQNLGDGYYQLNWKSPASYARSCKTLMLNLGEGSGPRTARFQFTK